MDSENVVWMAGRRDRSTASLRCSKCGASANATCECGVAYVPAGEFAKRAVEENPEMSNRALADKAGVNETTVRRARKARAAKAAPDKHTGKDGKSYPAKRPSKKIDKAVEALSAKAAAGEPGGTRKLAEEIGVSHATMDAANAILRDRNERGVDEDALAKAAEAVLPKSGKDRLELALKRRLKELEREFEERVRQRSLENDERLWKPFTNEKLAMYEQVVAGRAGVFSKAEYNQIMACLHPDHVAMLGADWVSRHNEAFRLFREAEIKLVDNKESPQTSDSPWTVDDLLRRREEVRAERAAKRAARKAETV